VEQVRPERSTDGARRGVASIRRRNSTWMSLELVWAAAFKWHPSSTSETPP
jgi:hypothetical protein